MSGSIGKRAYAETFGPTVGDRVRLADTNLIIEVEADHTRRAGAHFGGYDDELKFGRGGSIRDGMSQSQTVNGPGHHEAADCVITNALIVDHWGIVKADIGLKGCRIAAIGKAGNPDVMDGVDIVIGPGTEVIAGEGMIVTAGGIDSHVHFTCPQQIDDALASGITTMLGGGTGPASGSVASACTPGPENLHRMLQAADAFAMNLGFLGKGNASQPEALSQQIAAGAIGLTLHEAWGTTPAAIDNGLDIAEVTDTRVSLHSDTLNESGFIEHAVAATKGRTLCACPLLGDVPDAASDVLRVVGQANFLPGSTGRTMARADGRIGIGQQALAAEAVLHDLGAISIIGSGSPATGRIGDVILHTWQTAHQMKLQRGALQGDTGPGGLAADGARNDNSRVKRYIAKYTVNPAIASGISHEVGSVEIGKWADLVLWRPAYFGVKPSLVLKGGFIAAAAMGDSAAGTAAPQAVRWRPMFGSFARARTGSSLTFVSQAALRGDIGDELGLHKRLASVQHCRAVKKADMLHNVWLPVMEIDARSGGVRADGRLLSCEPATVLPLAQRYFLF